MSIHAALNHVTHYKYDRPVQLGPQVVRLRPAPHCRTQRHLVFAAGRAGRALHQLAAGPVRQLPGAAGVPREDDASSRSRSTWWSRWRSTTRSTSSSSRSAENFPFKYEPESQAQELAPYLVTEPATPLLQAYLEQHRPQAAAHHRLPGRHSTSRCSSDIKLPDPHGARRADARGDARELAAAPAATPAGCWCSCCATCGLAARFVSGYLIQLTPDVKALDGPSGTDGRLHRPARLVRGLPARRRLDRPRPDLGPAGRRRPHPAGLHARSLRAPRRSKAWSTRPRSSSATTCRSRASTNRRASPSPTPRSNGPRCWRSATRSTSDLAAGDVRLTMGGEPTFVAIDDRDARRMEHRRARPDQARLRHRAGAQAARRIRPGRLPAFRPGQVVPGRAAAALGAVDLLARRRPAGLARPRALRRRARADALHQRRRAALHRTRWPRKLGLTDKFIAARLRGRLLLPVARAPPAGQRRPVRLASSTTRWSACACAACSTQKLDAVVGYVLPLQAATRTRRAGGPELDDRPLVPARRAHVPDPRRFADGLPPAAGLAALGQQGRLPVPDRARPVRAARRAAAAATAVRATQARASRRTARPRAVPDAARRRSDAARAMQAPADGRRRLEPDGRAGPHAASRPPGSRRTALCVEVRDPRRANGPQAEQARQQDRRALRLHAAAGAAGGLPRPARRRRSHGAASSACRSCWKAIRRRATRA